MPHRHTCIPSLNDMEQEELDAKVLACRRPPPYYMHVVHTRYLYTGNKK